MCQDKALKKSLTTMENKMTAAKVWFKNGAHQRKTELKGGLRSKMRRKYQWYRQEHDVTRRIPRQNTLKIWRKSIQTPATAQN